MRTSLFIFFMVIFIGCSENDIIDEGEKPEDPQAEIEVYYLFVFITIEQPKLIRNIRV